MKSAADTPVSAKPSDFPRDEKFRDPRTRPFRDEDGFYHVFSYRDTMRVLVNRDRVFSRERTWLPPGIHHMAFDFMWAFEPFTDDGREGRHDALRAVTEAWFGKKAVRVMEPLIRNLTVDLINEIVAKGTGEFNLPVELAYPLSMRVICRLIGIDLAREEWLREKLIEFSQTRSYHELSRQWDVEAYFWEMVAKRLAHPRDELLDVLVDAWTDDRITDRELLGYLFGFLTAGTDTTGTNFVNAFALLGEFGLLDYTQDVLDDREALGRLIEEVLRFGTPFPKKPILVRRDCSFGGLRVPEGSVLCVWFASANRDEAVNGGVDQSDPNVFDPQRWPNRHVALGWGRHFCLGGDLARLETRTLLREGIRRLPGLETDDRKPFKRFAGIVDGVTDAHFRFDQRAAERLMRAGRMEATRHLS